MSARENYLSEYNKHKHIEIVEGEYCVKNRTFIVYNVLQVDNENEVVILERNGNTISKTLHWCRKKLEKNEK